MTLSLNWAGGSLVLSEGGICVVGNLSAQKKDIRDSLQKSILNKPYFVLCVSKQAVTL